MRIVDNFNGVTVEVSIPGCVSEMPGLYSSVVENSVDNSKSMDETIFEELEALLHNMYYSFANKFPVPGMEPDDIVQELRIKVWETLQRNKFDPNRDVRPSTFFHLVLTRHAMNLQRAALAKKRQDDMLAKTSHSIDYEWDSTLSGGESSIPWADTQLSLSVPFDHYLCDRCHRLVDEHTNYMVFTAARHIYCCHCRLELCPDIDVEGPVYYEVATDTTHGIYTTDSTPAQDVSSNPAG